MLNFLNMISEYATYVVIIVFISLITYFFNKMNFVNSNLKQLLLTFNTIKKDNIV